MVSPSRAEAWKSRGRGCWGNKVAGPARQTQSSAQCPTSLPNPNLPQVSLPTSREQPTVTSFPEPQNPHSTCCCSQEIGQTPRMDTQIPHMILPAGVSEDPFHLPALKRGLEVSML